MTIKEVEFFYGAALLRIANCGAPISIRPLDYDTRGNYLINETVPLYIKYTSKKLTPWSFSLTRAHQDDFQKAKDCFGSAFIAFVCGQDGICCLEYDALKRVLDHVYADVEWVRITRRKNESYGIKGTDGELKNKISDSDFPKVILKKLDIKYETNPVLENTSSCKPDAVRGER